MHPLPCCIQFTRTLAWPPVRVQVYTLQFVVVTGKVLVPARWCSTCVVGWLFSLCQRIKGRDFFFLYSSTWLNLCEYDDLVKERFSKMGIINHGGERQNGLDRINFAVKDAGEDKTGMRRSGLIVIIRFESDNEDVSRQITSQDFSQQCVTNRAQPGEGKLNQIRKKTKISPHVCCDEINYKSFLRFFPAYRALSRLMTFLLFFPPSFL